MSEISVEGFAPCPTCHQYSHSIGEDQIAAAFLHFQSMHAHPVRGHPMGYNFYEKTRDAVQVLIAALSQRDEIARERDEAQTIASAHKDAAAQFQRRALKALVEPVVDPGLIEVRAILADRERDEARAQLEKEQDAIDGYHSRALAAEARCEKLEGALTPSVETKVAYIGEFGFDITLRDDQGGEYSHHVSVPWTTIKEIMAAIARQALTDQPKGGE